MVTTSMTSYPPAAAYQGARINTVSKSEPTSKLAPAAGTQAGGQKTGKDQQSSDRNRGKTVDISA
ncbi:MAG: hypothetical protein K8R48_10590 [Alphaproteobacteria bacterium]|nr:hypothetical protein [Alphaproteobacteria bacterium]